MDQGKDISERLVDGGSDVDLPSRVANWSTPQGNALWSAFGDTCEPELTVEDESLAHELIQAGSVSGKFDFYDGPLDTLVDALLATYPPPKYLDEILAEQDYAVAGYRTILAGGVPSETIEGFNGHGFGERVTLPQDLSTCISVREVRREYNIA